MSEHEIAGWVLLLGTGLLGSLAVVLTTPRPRGYQPAPPGGRPRAPNPPPKKP
jgi:hypothetical protein